LTWVIVGLLFFAIEMATPSFFIICFGLGALAASLMAALGFSLYVQLGVFLVVTVICLAGLRKFGKLTLTGRETKTNYNALVGKTGIVTREIAPEKDFGRVSVQGEDWAAVAETSTQLEVGARVKVLAVSGVRLIVCRAEDRAK